MLFDARYLASKERTYISNNSQVLEICIFDLTQFHGKGQSQIAKNPAGLAILLFDCDIHNANPITFYGKIPFSSEVIAPGAGNLGSVIVAVSIGDIADVCTSSNACGVDL